MRPNQAPARATLTFIWCAGVFALPNGDHMASNLRPRAERKPYTIISGNNCSKIASKRYGNIKLDDLYRYNEGLKETCNSRKVS